MESNRQTRLLQIVMLVVLAATLFNTVQANRVAIGTREFRRETRHQMANTRQALAEQRQINADLERQLQALRATDEARQQSEASGQ